MLFIPASTLIGHTTQQICLDEAEVILVVSKSLIQLWYNAFQEILCDQPYKVDQYKITLVLPQILYQFKFI